MKIKNDHFKSYKYEHFLCPPCATPLVCQLWILYKSNLWISVTEKWRYLPNSWSDDGILLSKCIGSLIITSTVPFRKYWTLKKKFSSIYFVKFYYIFYLFCFKIIDLPISLVSNIAFLLVFYALLGLSWVKFPVVLVIVICTVISVSSFGEISDILI